VGTRKQWNHDLSHRKIVTELLKDGKLGKKRLMSMPDRITNTIVTADEGEIYRPTVINCYGRRIDNLDEWWTQWRQFIFDRNVVLQGKTESLPQAAIARWVERKH